MHPEPQPSLEKQQKPEHPEPQPSPDNQQQSEYQEPQPYPEKQRHSEYKEHQNKSTLQIKKMKEQQESVTADSKLEAPRVGVSNEAAMLAVN